MRTLLVPLLRHAATITRAQFFCHCSASCWHFLCVSTSFLRSVSTTDLLMAFTGEVWAHCCTACAQTFLRPKKGLVKWRGTAVSLDSVS